MDKYDEGYLRRAEQKVEELRQMALKKARAVVPAAEYAVDPRLTDDYYDKVWDYPGVWYVSFRLPDGFKSEEAVIEDIAANTIRHYLGRKTKNRSC